MIDKTLLVDLKKKLYIRSSLLGITGLDTLLGMSDLVSADEVLLEIIKKALREYEVTLPLIWEFKVDKSQMIPCENIGAGFFEFKSNFTLYLNCALSLDRVCLVPVSTPMWRVAENLTDQYGAYGAASSYPVAGSYQYFSDYRKPYVYMGDIPMTTIYVRGICARPIIPDWVGTGTTRKFNTASESAAVYWMDIETGGARGQYFLDLCLVHLLDFIRQLKASITLPNMPVDVLANVDSSYQELRSRCDQYALQSGWYGDLLL